MNWLSFKPQSAGNCVFLHGMAQNPSVQGSSTYDNPNPLGGVYFNDYLNSAYSMCSAVYANTYDTVTQGANNANLMNEFHNEANRATGWNDRLFAHSMGNVVLANLAVQGRTHKWFAMQGPFTGSTDADRMYEWCPGTSSPSSTWWGSILGYIANAASFCSNAVFSLETCAKGYPQSAMICQGWEYSYIQYYIHGSMCGNSGWGLNSAYSAALSAIGSSITSYSPNDGVVEWGSCTSTTPSQSYISEYYNRWYSASINHIDGEGINGNGWWGDDRQPVKWVEDMINYGWMY